MGRIKNMTVGNPTKLIVLFALPLMIGNIGQQLYMIVDAIIVGQGVGVEALASLGATDWIYWLILWMIQSFAQGFAILITQKFGAEDHKALKKSVTMSMWLSLIIGVVFTIIGILMAKPLLILLKTPENILDGALVYVTTLFAGTVIVMAYNMASSILRAFGDGKSPLIAMAIAAGINIGLDLLFVMVFHWGIFGAALATLLAQLFSFVYCWMIIKRNPFLNLSREDWKFDRAISLKLWKLGYPLALQHGFIAIGGMILQSVINGFGFLFVAGFTATNKLYGMLESTAISFGFATSTYMGQNYGAKKWERIDSGMKSAAKLSVLVSLVITAGMILIGRNLLGLFVSASEANAGKVVDIAYQYLVIMSALLSSLYILHVYRSALQGLGNTIASLISGIIEFFMRVGTALILPRFFGEIGIFFSEPAAWIGAAVYLVIAYYREVKKIKGRVGAQVLTSKNEMSVVEI